MWRNMLIYLKYNKIFLKVNLTSLNLFQSLSLTIATGCITSLFNNDSFLDVHCIYKRGNIHILYSLLCNDKEYTYIKYHIYEKDNERLIYARIMPQISPFLLNFFNIQNFFHWLKAIYIYEFLSMV